ncbi:hypothetical protein TWF281_000373 [Arthrobotrys megalospora]
MEASYLWSFKAITIRVKTEAEVHEQKMLTSNSSIRDFSFKETAGRQALENRDHELAGKFILTLVIETLLRQALYRSRSRPMGILGAANSSPHYVGDNANPAIKYHSGFRIPKLGRPGAAA